MKQKLPFWLAIMLISVFANAQTWTQQASGFTTVSRGIHHLHAVDSNVVWATAYDGVTPTAQIQEFTRTTNGGTTWTAGSISGVSGYGISMICAIDALTAWVPAWGPSGGGKILKTTDGGLNWVHQPTAGFAAPAGFPNVIYFWNANDGWCQGDPNGGYFEMYTTTNGGATWTRVPQANIPAPIASDEYGTTGYYSVQGNTVWFTTNKGRVFKSTNKGLNWTAVSTSITASQMRISFANQSLGLVQENVSPYRVLKSTDGGQSWQSLSYSGLMFTNCFNHVPGTQSTFVSSGSDLTNQMSGLSYSTDGGNTWTLFPSTDTTQFLGVSFANPRHGWSGAFSKSSTNGGMWKYSGNLFSPNPCANFQVSFSASATTVDLAVSGLVNFTDQSIGSPSTYSWTFGDGGTSAIQNPSHTYTSVGTYTAKLIATSGSCQDSSKQIINVVNTSGIDQNTKTDVRLFPNLTHDYFTIVGTNGDVKVSIIDMSGRVVLNQYANGKEIVVKVNSLPQGIYMVRIEEGNKFAAIRKLVVQQPLR